MRAAAAVACAAVDWVGGPVVLEVRHCVLKSQQMTLTLGHCQVCRGHRSTGRSDISKVPDVSKHAWWSVRTWLKTPLAGFSCRVHLPCLKVDVEQLDTDSQRVI